MVVNDVHYKHAMLPRLAQRASSVAFCCTVYLHTTPNSGHWSSRKSFGCSPRPTCDLASAPCDPASRLLIHFRQKRQLLKRECWVGKAIAVCVSEVVYAGTHCAGVQQLDGACPSSVGEPADVFVPAALEVPRRNCIHRLRCRQAPSAANRDPAQRQIRGIQGCTDSQTPRFPSRRSSSRGRTPGAVLFQESSIPPPPHPSP